MAALIQYRYWEFMSAPYPAKAVANFFLKRARRRRITQMKLHKLLHYAHGWHLGLTDEPLLDERIEAWQYGPVVPSIYCEFKMFGSDPIDRLAREHDLRTFESAIVPPVSKSDRFAFDLLERVWHVYGKLTAARLSALTHASDSPWTLAKQADPVGLSVEIPDDVIRSHFKERLSQDRNDS